MLKKLIPHLAAWLFFCQGYSSLFVDASGLYWRAHENGLAYAIRSPSTHKLAPNSKVENPDFDWDFGFRIGLGYRFSNDYDLLLQFTSLQTHASSDTFAHHGEVLFPSWQKPNESGPHFAKHVHTHWRLHLGIVDLLLAKRCEFSDYFALIPQAGVRAGSIRQKYYLDYFGGSFTHGEEIIHMKNKFFGVGPNAGLAVEWGLGKGFSLFGKSLFSLLFGHFFLHQNDYADGGKERPLGVRNYFSATGPVMDFTAGLSWKSKHVWLALAWDELLCFSQNQLLRFTSPEAEGIFFSNQGDLFVSGVEFAMRFDF